MADQDDNEVQGVVLGVLGAVVFGVIALVISLSVWKLNRISAASAPVQAPVTQQALALPAATAAAQTALLFEESDIVPVGEALAKVYFPLGGAVLGSNDEPAIAATVAEVQARGDAIVLLSGFHDESGDAHVNAEIAKQRALAVREALLTAGVSGDRIKLRKPESTLGSGSAEEGRRVEIRVQ